ncbi:MAG: VWA domain-containing protein [Gammaproteobacteria bacterium]|nr:VWA domain-containing protein [Gammaproteobacteria bacterium]NNJ49587.1 VWA domain-containing protein [Gammaproteobacteria bacterium]
MNDLLNISLQDISQETLIILDSLHFVRSEWFYAFIPLLLFLLFSYRTRLNNRNWLGVIDAQLLPYVLTVTGKKQRRYPLLLVLIAASLCITALAGPVYKKLPQPVYREQSSLVVLLDLSQSMNATDIKTSRLSRAKLELLDLLKTRKSGQTALVVYAADAFVVTPLTDDNATIANLVPSLETDMMPAQGSKLSKALEKANSLFTQSGTVHGDILVITDDIHPRTESAIEKVVSQGHRVSIFGIGTAEGSPVPLVDGGFLQDRDGAIVLPRLDSARLQSYTLLGGGLYTALQADDSDVEKLAKLLQSKELSKDEDSSDPNNLSADVWQEEGHWLLLPLLFFAALWTRKGWLAALVLFVSSTSGPIPSSVYADTVDRPLLDTEHLWSSPDQKAMKAFRNGDKETAAREFTRPDWKASAYYRNGDYESAIETLQNTQSSDGFYNKANALVKLGRFEEAIEAYDRALELDESNADAEYNREQVKQALQQQQGSQQQENQQQDDHQQDGKDQQSQQQEQQQQDGQEQDGEQQDQDQQQPQQESEQPSDKNESEEQQSSQGKPQENDEQQEQEQLKQRDAEAEAEQQKQEEQQYQQQQKEQEEQDQSDSEANKNQEVEDKDSEQKPMDIEVNPMEASISEQDKATEQWLKRIPDDPGGLLRRKFHYQYKQIPNQTDSEQPW